MLNIKSRIYISILILVLFFIVYFLFLKISFLSIIFAILILLSFTLVSIIFRNYFFDILNIKKLSLMIKEGNYDYKPNFSTIELQSIIQNINKLESEISELKDKSLVVDKMKNDFIYLVSHELRTPVTSALGYIDILESSNVLVSEDKKALERLHSNLSDLNNVVEEILSIVFLESDDFKLNNTEERIKPLIEEILSEIKEKIQFAIGFSYDGPQDVLKIDKSLFKKIINNILSNSIKFNKKDGIISVVVYREDKFFVVKISDSGIGISKDDVSTLFTPFVRKTSMLDFNYQGLGLGLYMAKVLIEKMGGKISISSSVNKGSSFLLYFPY